MALSVTFDHAQRRLQSDQLIAFAEADEFTGPVWDSVWNEPVSHRLLLRPYVMDSTGAWTTTDSGNYAKLALTDIGSPAGWEERADQHIKGKWLCKKDSSAGGSASTTASYSKNRGFYFAFFGYGAGGRFIQARCGWNSSASLSGGVGLEIWNDGTIDVYKDGTKFQTGKVCGTSGGSTQQNQLFELLLLPYAHREMLIMSPSAGDGFNAIFDDIDEDDTNPTITPAGHFWFEIVVGAVQVMLAPLKFPSSGYATSDKLNFLDPPQTGEALENYDNLPWPGSSHAYLIYGDPAYVSTQSASATLVKWDGTTAFVPNSVQVNTRIKLTLTTSDTGYTPTIYGALLSYPALFADTSAAEQYDATGYMESVSLSVPESPSGVAMDLKIGRCVDLETHVHAVQSQPCRPVNIQVGSVGLLNGIASTPKVHTLSHDGATWMELEVRDRWKLLEDYVFTDRFAYDGWIFEEFVKFLVRKSGLASSHISVSTSGFNFPQARGTRGEFFSNEVQPGDKAAEVLTRIMEDFATDWWYGFRYAAGGVEFFAYSPADLPGVASITLYETSSEAVAAGHATPDEYNKYQIREFREQVLEPLANEIRITGYDSKTKRPIQAYKVDAASQNPTTVPSSRPDNWVGNIRHSALVDPALSTQAAVNWACDTAYNELTVAPVIAEWKSDFLLSDITGAVLWRGSLVEIAGRGTYRINSFGCDFVREVSTGDDPFQWRNATYTARKIA